MAMVGAVHGGVDSRQLGARGGLGREAREARQADRPRDVEQELLAVDEELAVVEERFLGAAGTLRRFGEDDRDRSSPAQRERGPTRITAPTRS